MKKGRKERKKRRMLLKNGEWRRRNEVKRIKNGE